MLILLLMLMLILTLTLIQVLTAITIAITTIRAEVDYLFSFYGKVRTVHITTGSSRRGRQPHTE